MFGITCLLISAAYASQCKVTAKLSASIARFNIHNGVVPFSSPSAVSIAAYPFMAWLMHPALPATCYAVIVHKKFLVTAARCNYKHLKHDYFLTTGAETTTGNGEIHEIELIISHPKFHEDYIDNDIAVAMLKEDLKFNDNLKAIPMASENVSFENDDFFTTLGIGFKIWKHYYTEWAYSNHLYKVYLPYVNHSKCQQYLNDSPITENMICVGDTRPQNDAQCNFKFGGPLIHKGQLVGVMSFGHDGAPCSLPGFPTVFASIATARPFIDKVISDHFLAKDLYYH